MTTSLTLRSVKGSALTHDEMDTNLSNLKATADAAAATGVTLTANKAEATALGVANTDQNMGSFTGTTISDNVSAKAAIQALETAHEQTSAFDHSVTYPTGTVGKKLLGEIDPRDAPYSAAGDGATDDNTALQSAITAGATAGKPVFIQGTFIASNLTIPSNAIIYGPGTIKRKAAATGYLLSGSGAADVNISGITVDGNSYTGDNSQLIRFEGASHDLVINGITVKNGNLDGIALAGTSARATIINNRCITNKAAGIVVATTGAGAHRIAGNTCRSNYGSGISVSADYTVVEGNRCNANGTGITSVAGILMISCNYPIANDNQTVANGTGSYFAHGIQFNTCANGVMSGNFSQGNNGSGLDMYVSTGSTCTGNQTINNNLRGIEVDSGSTYTTVVGNIAQGNQAAGISIYNTVGAVVNNNTVSGNGTLGTANNPLIGAANEPYGIALWGAGNYGNYANVSNNVIALNIGSGSNGVGLYVHASCVGVNLSDNLFSANTVQATIVAANIAFAKDNQGLYFTQLGAATIASGTTSIAVSFAQTMTIAPVASGITLTMTNSPTAAPGELYVTSISATGFTINCRTDPGAGGANISWKATA